MRLYKLLFLRYLALTLVIHMTLFTSHFASALTTATATQATASQATLTTATTGAASSSQGYLLSQNQWIADLYPVQAASIQKLLQNAPSGPQIQTDLAQAKTARSNADFGDKRATSGTGAQMQAMSQNISQLNQLNNYQNLLNTVMTYGPQLSAYLKAGNYTQAWAYAVQHSNNGTGLVQLLETSIGLKLMGLTNMSLTQMESFYDAAWPYWNGNILGTNPYSPTLWGDPNKTVSDATANFNTSGDGSLPDIARFAGKRPSESLFERWGKPILEAVAAIVIGVCTAGAGAVVGAALFGSTTAAATVAGTVIVGAAEGAAEAAAEGGNIELGALGGAVGGGVSSGLATTGVTADINSGVANVVGTTAAPYVTNVAIGTATGTVLDGGHPLPALTGAVEGAAEGAASGAISDSLNAQTNLNTQLANNYLGSQSAQNAINNLPTSSGLTVPSMSSSDASTTTTIAGGGVQTSGFSLDGTSAAITQDGELAPIVTTAQRLPASAGNPGNVTATLTTYNAPAPQYDAYNSGSLGELGSNVSSLITTTTAGGALGVVSTGSSASSSEISNIYNQGTQASAAFDNGVAHTIIDSSEITNVNVNGPIGGNGPVQIGTYDGQSVILKPTTIGGGSEADIAAYLSQNGVDASTYVGVTNMGGKDFLVMENVPGVLYNSAQGIGVKQPIGVSGDVQSAATNAINNDTYSQIIDTYNQIVGAGISPQDYQGIIDTNGNFRLIDTDFVAIGSSDAAASVTRDVPNRLISGLTYQTGVPYDGTISTAATEAASEAAGELTSGSTNLSVNADGTLVRVLPDGVTDIYSASTVSNSDLPLVYRGDERSPDVIFNEGFESWNDNLDMFDHLQAAQSNYISTSTDSAAGARFATSDGWTYTIDNPGYGYNADALSNATSDHLMPLANESEVAFPGGIPAENIVSATRTAADGTVTTVMNPNYVPRFQLPTEEIAPTVLSLDGTTLYLQTPYITGTVGDLTASATAALGSTGRTLLTVGGSALSIGGWVLGGATALDTLGQYVAPGALQNSQQNLAVMQATGDADPLSAQAYEDQAGLALGLSAFHTYAGPAVEWTNGKISAGLDWLGNQIWNGTSFILNPIASAVDSSTITYLNNQSAAVAAYQSQQAQQAAENDGADENAMLPEITVTAQRPGMLSNLWANISGWFTGSSSSSSAATLAASTASSQNNPSGLSNYNENDNSTPTTVTTTTTPTLRPVIRNTAGLRAEGEGVNRFR